MNQEIKTQTGAAPSARNPEPWSLPLATDISVREFKTWHDLVLRMPDALQRGVGGARVCSDLDDLVAPARDAIVQASPDLTTGTNRVSQAIERRVFNHDLLDTVLLHGQERVSELMTVGETILKRGLTIPNPRQVNFHEPLRLDDGTVVALRAETLEALAHSTRYLLLRTQSWMRRFPARDYQLADGPASTKDIERGLSKGLNRECARAYEIAIALVSLPRTLQERLLSLSTPTPCTPYAEAIPLDFERDYQTFAFEAWKIRKALEPDGQGHRAASRARIEHLSLRDQAFLHRLVRYRLDTLRRCGQHAFSSLVKDGEEALKAGLRPLERGAVLTSQPLSSLSLRPGTRSIDDRILENLTQADHTGWLHTVHFFDALGIDELRQPRGAARGDGADVSYQDLPQSMRNRVRVNVLAAFVGLAKEASLRAHLERKQIGV